MAPEKKRKREATTNTTPKTDAKSTTTKKPKTEFPKDDREHAGPAVVTASTLKKVKPAEEETHFPRGGAQVLTPLEYKEVANEAARDVLFGASGKAGDVAVEVSDKAKKVKKFQKRNEKKTDGGKAKDGEKEEKESGPKVEGFSYKRLVPGTLVLGCVEKIGKTDISLALPNNLTGFIPITQISEIISARLEAMMDVDSSDDSEAEGDKPEKEEKEDEDDIELEQFFKIGQYLRAYVLHSVEEVADKGNTKGQTKTKKRIELSLIPSLANTGLTPLDLSVGITVQASVASVEDHGLVMDMGIGGDLKGFLSSKELGNGFTIADAKEGQSLLCTVTGLSSNGKIVKLSGDIEQKLSKKGKLPGGKSSWWLSEATTIDAFLPGTGVEILVTEVGKHGGIVGKIMGMLDAVADYFHVAGWEKDLEEKVTTGTKIKARITSTFPDSEPKKVSFSILPHILQLTTAAENDPLTALPIATIIDTAKVIGVESNVGLFVDIGVEGVKGFVHISRISSEDKIEELSKDMGPYKIGTIHRARILGYNPMDGLYILSTEKRVLEQTFLRVEDVKVGSVVKGKVLRMLERGGLQIELSDGILGNVEEEQISDVKLKNPEKKYREGVIVKARVLAINLHRRKVILTLKKTLVNSDAPLITSYEVAVGIQSVGTIVNLQQHGAVVKFYNGVSAWLPVSEMSEAYISDAREHFRVGQSVIVHVVSVDPENRKMRVSCKDPSLFGSDQIAALAALKPGQIIEGKVSEKTDDDIMLDLENVGASGLKGMIVLGHMTDGSREKNAREMKTIRAGQNMKDLVILDKNEGRRMIYLSNKKSLVQAAKASEFPTKFEDLSEGMTVKGFIKNTADIGVFVSFAGGLTGLVLRSGIPDDKQSLPNYGYTPLQSVSGHVVQVNAERQKFLVSLRPKDEQKQKKGEVRIVNADPKSVVNPVDEKTATVDQYVPGVVTKARVLSVQETQVNVQLADNVQGRIDVSQMFETWEQIPNRKVPLEGIKKGTVLPVRIIGVHDARNHRFLAITHRVSNTKTPIFELSARKSDVEADKHEALTLEKVAPGSNWIGFVNSITPDCAWVNISPGVRGRIRILDLSDDVSQLRDVPHHFPIGSAIKCHVVSVDVSAGRLDLSAKPQSSTKLTMDSLSPGMVVPGRVTKVLERQIQVQISDTLFGFVNQLDIADDYDQADTKSFNKNDIVRVCILTVDKPNKRVILSTRPSRTLDSKLPVKDAEVNTIDDVAERELRRGFVKNVSDKGLFVALGSNVTAWCKVADLSDSFLKDWKTQYKVGQVVEGRIVNIDAPANHIQMSLRPSVVTGKIVRQKGLEDYEVGQVVTGKIRKVETYGVFIGIDGTSVSGLCHKSQIADRKVEDLTKLYSEGDAVKAKVLAVDVEKRRISFGLKASYFQGEDGDDDEESGDEDEDSDSDVDIHLGGEEEESSDEEGGVDLGNARIVDDGESEEESDEEEDSDEEMADAAPAVGLSAGGFDWSATAPFTSKRTSDSDSDAESTSSPRPKKKKRTAAGQPVDLTASLQSRAPQSASDYERLLLGTPNDSALWIAYMAFHLQLSELQTSRAIAERALKTISQREDAERRNIWIAMLNMENSFGDQDSLDAVFARAVQYCDALDIHQVLLNLYISAGKTDLADALLTTALKKFSQAPELWLNAASFYMETQQQPTKAWDTLKRALQALPVHAHRDLTLKYATLEFRAGDAERARTLLENVIKTYSKRMDVWGVYVDLEVKYGGLTPKDAKADKSKKLSKEEKEDRKEALERVRRVLKRALEDDKCGAKQAAGLFRRWKEVEEKFGDDKGVASVQDRARAWMEKEKDKKSKK